MQTLSRFALIGVIGSSAAGCSSDTLRLSDPFTNPFSSSKEPAATGSLGSESEPMHSQAPAIRTPRVETQALGAPSPSMSPRPIAPPVSAAPSSGAVSGMNPAVSGLNPGAARPMTPVVAPPAVPAPQPKLQFSQGPKPVDVKANTAEAARKEAAARKLSEAKKLAEATEAKRAAELKVAEAKRAAELKVAEAKRAAELKVAEAKAAEAKAAEKAAEARKLSEAEAKKKAVLAGAKPITDKSANAKAKPDPKLEAARKAEAEAKLARAEVAKEAAKKVAEAKAAEAAAKVAAKEAAKEAAKQAAAKESATKVGALKEPAVKESAAKEPEKPIASAEPAATGSVAPASTDSFRWPAKGRVINGYGSAGNEGINIAVPEGTPVKAAEEGTVAYAGSDVKGYGKLVLVRHSNGFVSAYAHNAELDVRPGDKVKRGQTIAKSGATGNVTSPQLHFEIRKGATPVDPIPHLASN